MVRTVNTNQYAVTAEKGIISKSRVTEDKLSSSLQQEIFVSPSYLFLIGNEVKLFLCLTSKALCPEDIWGSGNIAPPFLTSALDGVEWSASRPCRFTPEEEIPMPTA
jgi:hypothetical protein